MIKSSAYPEIGVDPVHAVELALQVPISIHCWQADDVAGLESGGAAGSVETATEFFSSITEPMVGIVSATRSA